MVFVQSHKTCCYPFSCTLHMLRLAFERSLSVQGFGSVCGAHENFDPPSHPVTLVCGVRTRERGRLTAVGVHGPPQHMLLSCTLGGMRHLWCATCCVSPALRAVALYAYRPPFARKTLSEFASACMRYVEWTAQFIGHVYIHNGRIRHFYVFLFWNAGISFERIGDWDKAKSSFVWAL